MTGAAITVEDVSKRFRLYHERNQSLKLGQPHESFGGVVSLDGTWQIDQMDTVK